MGNCINLPASHLPAENISVFQAPAENVSEISSPGSMPDTAPQQFPRSYATNQLDSPIDWELLRSKARPGKEQSEVSRFLDVTRHKNARSFGEEGAELHSTASPMLQATPDDASPKETRHAVSRSNSQ